MNPMCLGDGKIKQNETYVYALRCSNLMTFGGKTRNIFGILISVFKIWPNLHQAVYCACRKMCVKAQEFNCPTHKKKKN